MYSTGSPQTQQKEEEKGGSLIRKTGFKNHQKEQKSSERIISTRRPHLWTKKKKCQSKQMTCQNPFQKRKRHRGKEENH